MNINLLRGQRAMALRQTAQTETSTHRVHEWTPATIKTVDDSTVGVQYDDGQGEILSFKDVAVVLYDLNKLDVTQPTSYYEN